MTADELMTLAKRWRISGGSQEHLFFTELLAFEIERLVRERDEFKDKLSVYQTLYFEYKEDYDQAAIQLRNIKSNWPSGWMDKYGDIITSDEKAQGFSYTESYTIPLFAVDLPQEEKPWPFPEISQSQPALP